MNILKGKINLSVQIIVQNNILKLFLNELVIEIIFTQVEGLCFSDKSLILFFQIKKSECSNKLLEVKSGETLQLLKPIQVHKKHIVLQEKYSWLIKTLK